MADRSGGILAFVTMKLIFGNGQSQANGIGTLIKNMLEPVNSIFSYMY